MSQVDPKNRMNDLDSRNWLQFQKSWFIYDALPIEQFVRFFTKKTYPDGRTGRVAYFSLGETTNQQKSIAERVLFHPRKFSQNHEVDYAFIDLSSICSAEELHVEKDKLGKLISWLEKNLVEKHYITVVARNQHTVKGSQSIAWQLAALFSRHFSMKDEKIGCAKGESAALQPGDAWMPENTVTYFLHFRKENPPTRGFAFTPPSMNGAVHPAVSPGAFRDGWYIHKPPPRPKGVLLHPAKFPEKLIQQYIETFCAPGDWVFDPMTGTGSTLVAALESGHKACGIELNPDFVEIAQTRFPHSADVQLVTGDAGEAKVYQALPEQIDYCITSPPYWDMLRMRGSETQKKRKNAGLQRWYSEDPRDTGNIENYEAFLDSLQHIYEQVGTRLKPGGHLTIIVKNVKKKGVIYPLAWDIVQRLQNTFLFLGEQFWCQDDQRLAPFGYRYAWVSNTFHHYCLTFQRRVEQL